MLARPAMGFQLDPTQYTEVGVYTAQPALKYLYAIKLMWTLNG